MGLIVAAALFVSAADPPPIDVWLDVDAATGVGDVDDGLMMIQCFHSPELTVRGISVVFGNTTLSRAMAVAGEITEAFGPPGLAPQAGAASPDDLGEESDAVRAMAAELERRPLTILAVGPATNVATLLTRRKDLEDRIERIVLVAGRRPGQRFETSDRQLRPHPDANFEKDPRAMQVLLESNAPLAFAPWEVSSQVWISREDLEQLRGRSAAGEWIARTSQYWINLWALGVDSRGFNPFDTLAAGFLTHPHLVESIPVRVRIVEDLDDRATPRERREGKRKPYLVVAEPGEEGREAVYCVRPKPEFHGVLIERLAGPKESARRSDSPADRQEDRTTR
jgi:pyrimidine-specific ribonucleoside hydrolase